MPSSRVCLVVESPVEPIWDLLADFPNWGRWLSQVADSVVSGGITHSPGALRVVGPPGDPRVHEQLVAVDARSHTLSYRVTEQPVWRVPARDYLATVHLLTLTDRPATVVDWSSRYDCDLAVAGEIDELLRSLYVSFIAGLEGAVLATAGR